MHPSPAYRMLVEASDCMRAQRSLPIAWFMEHTTSGRDVVAEAFAEVWNQTLALMESGRVGSIYQDGHTACAMVLMHARPADWYRWQDASGGPDYFHLTYRERAARLRALSLSVTLAEVRAAINKP